MERCRCGALDCRKCYPVNEYRSDHGDLCRCTACESNKQERADYIMDLMKDREMDWEVEDDRPGSE